MRQVADGVWQLDGFPRDVINVYLVGDVLIDAGTRFRKRRLLRELEGRNVRLVALTHCHPDHQGAVKAVCERFGVLLACHEADVPAVEGYARMEPDSPLLRFMTGLWAGPPHPVGRVLRDGDEVGGFRVVHAPGHTPGHVIYIRDADHVAIAGDVLANIHFLTGKPGLREPPAAFSHTPAQNRRSARLLAGLRPSLVCFGHGPPLRDASLLERFVENL